MIIKKKEPQDFYHFEIRTREGLVFGDTLVFTGYECIYKFIRVGIFFEEIPLLFESSYFVFDFVQIIGQ
jgi:hypothetical protein